MKEHKITQSLLKPINPTGIIILGIYTIVWGFWLANPWWDVFGRADLYSKMSRMLPEHGWGAIAVVAGITACYGAIRPSYNALVTGSLVMFFHWLMIAILYFAGDWQNTGGITSVTFSTYAAYIYLNVRVNFKKGHQNIRDILNR